MKSKNSISRLALSAMFLALSFLMPFLTGQIPQIGSMLCPMHIPVILCGYICGAPWGLAVGFVAPLLRSAILGMPPLFPSAVSMAFELAAYGLLSGVLYRTMKKSRLNIYLSLIISMVIGRLVWGLAQFICLGLDSEKFSLAAFFSGAVTTALPGIIIQLILIPLLIMLYENKLSQLIQD